MHADTDGAGEYTTFDPAASSSLKVGTGVGDLVTARGASVLVSPSSSPFPPLSSSQHCSPSPHSISSPHLVPDVDTIDGAGVIDELTSPPIAGAAVVSSVDSGEDVGSGDKDFSRGTGGGVPSFALASFGIEVGAVIGDEVGVTSTVAPDEVAGDVAVDGANVIAGSVTLVGAEVVCVPCVDGFVDSGRAGAISG